jgi:hypothetical protein
MLLFNYEYVYVVGNRTMVCDDGGGSISRDIISSRINN